MLIIFGICIIILLLAIIYLLLYSMLRGAPYAPIGEQKINNMLTLLKVKKGERAADIGAGDGRIIIALAKKGVEAHGYEINPVLFFLAKRNIKKANMQKKAFIHLADFWRQDLSSFDIVTIYLTAHIMPAVEKKLIKELKPKARVVVNYFPLPTWKPVQKEDTIYLYRPATNA